LLGVLGTLVSAAYAGEAPARAPAEQFRAAVQADWLLQDKVRTGEPARGGPKATPQGDAAGAVDGVKNGKYGFHTSNDAQPWWQVDLGKRVPLARVVVYNRCDGGCPSRNPRIELALSNDGKAWTVAYRHKGTPFGGVGHGKPLTVTLDGRPARFVRLQHPTKTWFHLDEVEVYPTSAPQKNIALGKPADQSSASRWSVEHTAVARGTLPASYPFARVLKRGRALAADLLENGAPVRVQVKRFEAAAQQAESLPQDASPEHKRQAYFALRWALRRLALANPLLDFPAIFFTKRVPGSFSHMSDQYYGWWSRPGGGLFVLRDFTTDSPAATDITPDLPEGSYLRPDLSYDAERILFAHCRYYKDSRGTRNKVDKTALPDDVFYHLYEMRLDGSGLRQLTRGRYDDFDGRYLPDGRIVFLSTRRGQFIQCGTKSAAETKENPYLPDSYVRCGGGNSRPVAVYTLHAMDADGSNLRCISPFENFEWTPSVAHDGRVLFARWDYIDRHNMPFMSLWAVRPDGGQLSLVYGNFTRSPHCIFEARPIPNSRKLMFLASGHHAITGGTVCLLDPAVGTEEAEPITRLTPEVRFPEIEGWPSTHYAHPYPLSEDYFLVSWSPKPIRPQGRAGNTNDRGIYLADAFGNLELLTRDPAISSVYPIPLRPRPRPHDLPEQLAETGPAEGRFLLLDVYEGLPGIPRGAVERLRIVGVPGKTQPQMNHPNLGATRDDPGKYVLGTVPVQPDGSAHFRAPGGVLIFFQALDADGMAVQTMRTATAVAPGQTTSCIGCHEHRSLAPGNLPASAAKLEPARITPGPEGSWPLDYATLVQPVLDSRCVKCHRPGGEKKAVAKLDLRPGKSYGALVNYSSKPVPVQFVWKRGPGGAPGRNRQPYIGVPQMANLSLHAHVRRRYGESRSAVGACAARMNPLLARLQKGHHEVTLSDEDLERLVTWMDTYGQRQGHFSPDQERRLRQLKHRIAPLLAERQ
jgi:hypothetical protein